MKSNIYLGENFKIGINSTVTVELNLSALGIQNSTITRIFGGFVTGVKEANTSTNVQFPFTIGDSSVLKKVDVVLSESLDTEWTLKDFPIYIYISTKEFGRYSHLVQVNLGVEPRIVVLSGELEAPGSVSLGDLPLEVVNASQYQSFNIKNTGQLSLRINEINFLEFNNSTPDYVSFTNYYGDDLEFPFSIGEGKETQVFVNFNTQTSHTDDNYNRILEVPVIAHGELQLVKNLMTLHREPSETDFNEMNPLDEYCKIEIISNDIRSPIYEFPIIQTKFVAPLMFVDLDVIDITNVMEGTDNYREIMIRNASPTEDLIISEISTDYYVTTSDGTSSGTPVDYMSISWRGMGIDFSSSDITIPAGGTEVFTLNFIDSRFPEYEISGSSDFTYFKNFFRTITIKSNAVNSFFTGTDTYSNVKANKSGETYIPLTVSITKKAVDVNPVDFINPDFEIILGGGRTPNQAIPTQGNISLEAIGEAFGKVNTDSDWEDYDHLDLNGDNLIDIFDLMFFIANMDTYESDPSNMGKPNAEAIYSDIPNEGLGTSKSLGNDAMPFSILNVTTSNFLDTPLGVTSDGDSIEYRLTISTNDFTISPNFHRDIPSNLSGDYKELVYIDDVPKALGKSNAMGDWSTYSHLDFNGAGSIDLFDLVSVGNAIKSADEEFLPTIEKIDANNGKTEDSPDWESISYLDLNGDGMIYYDDRVLVSQLDHTKTSNWVVDDTIHTWDSDKKVQIVKDWDDGNSWIYRAYWDTQSSEDLKSNPGIHFSNIPVTRNSVMESSLDLTITLYARRKNDIHKKEYSVSKTIKMFFGQSNIPRPIVNYKMLARKNSKFEYEGRAYNKNLETTNSLTDPTWEVFDIINHSQFAKNTGISEGMKGLWIEKDSAKFSDTESHFGTFTYDWKFSVKNGTDDQSDYGFVIANSSTVSDNGKIAWRTAIPTGGSNDYNKIDQTYWDAQVANWQPQGLVYKTSGIKTITSIITNTDYGVYSETHSKVVRIYKDFNEKMEITPVEVSLAPKALRKGITSVAYVTVKNTSLTNYRTINVEVMREFPNKIRFGETQEDKLIFDLTPQNYPGASSKEVAIYVDIISDHPRYKKNYSEGQVKISSESDEDYVVIDLYGEAESLTWDLLDLKVEFSVDDDENFRTQRYWAMTGYGTSYETTSPHAFVVGFVMSDNQTKGVASDAHILRTLNIDFDMQDQETHPIIKTHVLGNLQAELSVQDSQANTETANGFKVLYVNGTTPEIDLSLSDDKANKISLSYQLSHDIIMELSDSQVYRQKNKAVQVDSADPLIGLILDDSETRKFTRTHSIKANYIDPLIEIGLEDNETHSKIVGYWKNITVSGSTPSVGFEVEDDKTSRGTITHAFKRGGSTTLETNLQFSDSKLITIDYGAYKAIKVNNEDPVINLYWRDNYTKTIT